MRLLTPGLALWPADTQHGRGSHVLWPDDRTPTSDAFCDGRHQQERRRGHQHRDIDARNSISFRQTERSLELWQADAPVISTLPDRSMKEIRMAEQGRFVLSGADITETATTSRNSCSSRKISEVVAKEGIEDARPRRRPSSISRMLSLWISTSGYGYRGNRGAAEPGADDRK